MIRVRESELLRHCLSITKTGPKDPRRETSLSTKSLTSPFENREREATVWKEKWPEFESQRGNKGGDHVHTPSAGGSCHLRKKGQKSITN